MPSEKPLAGERRAVGVHADARGGTRGQRVGLQVGAVVGLQVARVAAGLEQLVASVGRDELLGRDSCPDAPENPEKPLLIGSMARKDAFSVQLVAAALPPCT